MNAEDLKPKKLHSFKYVYYLNTDDFPIELWSESIVLDYDSPGIFLDKYSTYIIRGGKVFSDKPIQELSVFFSDVAKHAKRATKIIAMGQQIKEGVYLVFCPVLGCSAEVVKTELLEVIARVKKKISSADIGILRLIANEIVCDLFYLTPVQSGQLNPKQWHGLLVVEESLKAELCSALLKLRAEEKEESLSSILTDERMSKFYTKLEMLGIGILSSLIATGIIQLIIRFVLSTPVGSPRLGGRTFEGNIIANFFKDDSGRFDLKKTVCSKEIAAGLTRIELSVIPFMNSIPVLHQVDRSTRAYKLVGNDYCAPDASFVSHSIESLVCSSFLESNMLSYLSSNVDIKFRYEMSSDVVDRPDGFCEMTECRESKKLVMKDKDINEFFDIYISL